MRACAWICVVFAVLFLACDKCPEGQTRLWEPDKKAYRCIDPDVEARRQLAAEESVKAAARVEEARREAEQREEIRRREKQYEAVDASLSRKHAANVHCGKPGAGCAMEELTPEEARRAPQWRAQQRMKARSKRMAGQRLNDVEEDLLKD